MIMYVIEHIGLLKDALGWLRIVDDVRTCLKEINSDLFQSAIL